MPGSSTTEIIDGYNSFREERFKGDLKLAGKDVLFKED